MPYQRNRLAELQRRQRLLKEAGVAEAKTRRLAAAQKHRRPPRRFHVLGCSLLDLRLARGMSLSDLARLAGVSFTTLSRAERGADLRLSAALRVAAALQVPVETLWRVLPQSHLLGK